MSYINCGWRTLIAGLHGAAEAAGAVLRCEHPIAALRREHERWLVEVAGRAAERFEAVVLAAPPAAARELANGSADIAAAALAAQPVRAMTLDLGLATTGPGASYALGIDAPNYLFASLGGRGAGEGRQGRDCCTCRASSRRMRRPRPRTSANLSGWRTG